MRLYQGRLKKYCLLVLLSLTLVVFLKYAENQSPLQFSYTGGQFYFADENNDTSGQIIHRETILRMNKSYTAYSGSTEAFIDSPATFKSSSESLKSNAGLMEPSKEPIKVIKNGVEPINIPMKFKKSKNSKFTQNLDLMKVKPLNFLPNYKNPCWKSPGSRIPISCLPYFYLIGAPKSGTTDVFHRLLAHPDFAKPFRKEGHWITRKRFDSERTSSIQYYADHYYSPAAAEIYKFKDKSKYHWKITGDCSASTLFDNHRWRWLPYSNSSEEPALTNADFLHHLNPDVRIMAILREPVDRLYSDFLYFNSQHDSQADFHGAVKKTLAWFTQCRQSRTLRSCIYDERGNRLPVRVLIGIYHVHLKEFFRVFPIEHVLVVKLEEYSKDPATAMVNIFRFLDLNENVKLRKDVNSTKHANPRRKDDRLKGGMWGKTRSLLQDFYRPHNNELFKLLNDEKFNYNAMYS